jgi:hypothetical protein
MLNTVTNLNLLAAKASAKGASSPSNVYGTIPEITRHTKIYIV